MSIEITENLVGIWFLQLNYMGDFVLALSRKEDRFELVYRFRYYDKEDPGNDAFSDKDRKSWFKADIKGISLEVAIGNVRSVMERMKKDNDNKNKIEELLMENGDVDAFIEKLTRLPFAHTKTIKLG